MTTTRRIAAAAGDWLADGRRVVAALLVGTEGSAPLEAGTMMLIADDGAIEGSITGGCVEGALVAEAEDVLAGGPPRVSTFGFSDELAGTVGLTCGGTVHVFVHELSGADARIEMKARRAIAEGVPTAIATLLDGPAAGAKLSVVGDEIDGSLGGPALLDHSVSRDAAGMLAQGRGGIRRYGDDGATLGADLAVHVSVNAASPKMLILGAIDFSAALARLATELGYEVSIADPRAPFLEAPRFRRSARTLVAWPDEAIAAMEFGPRDAILVFTHDPKFDQPALLGAVATEVGYIGALGSRRTTVAREARLRDAGMADAELARIHGPCGHDIGASTPEEVAISVLAEVIASRSGREGGPLVRSSNPIHADQGN